MAVFGVIVLSASPPAQQNDFDRFEHDQQVHFQRHVFYIKEIVLQFFLRFLDGSAISEHHLGPTSHPGFYRMPEGVIRDRFFKFGNEFGAFRARTDEVDIPFQHIEQLGQFIEAGKPQPFAQRRDAGVVTRGLGDDGAVLILDDDRPVIADFGLVHIPAAERITERPARNHFAQFIPALYDPGEAPSSWDCFSLASIWAWMLA